MEPPVSAADPDDSGDYDSQVLPCLTPRENLRSTKQITVSNGNTPVEVTGNQPSPFGDRTSGTQYNLHQNPVPSTRPRDYEV
ncbi:hypothetical protein NDU88_003647 [Pleurodeles waltl]|uniref:Uncharacterized protein n=1 Tax=Pleurodeles waltl TaxID=8319 RepID=A0AAV7PA65_PLEWA|nr:hypothetical protein NDU88_003647 [Pleurodeles waltl]